MTEGKLFKTKLCQLYQRGRCPRQFCNFAHGDAELRRSFNGRQEYRGRDLRERLDRMRSPLRSYSPGRDARARHSSHGDNEHLGRRIDRNHRKRQQLDVNGNYSDSLRMSEGSEDHNEDTRLTTSDIRMRVDELRQVHSEIKMLDNEKRKLETYLGDKIQEGDTLKIKIQELEMHILAEKEEGKRVTTKLKKFIKAHSRHLRLQDELKRSHAQLQKLGEQLDLDVTGPGNDDELKTNITADDETGGHLSISPFTERQLNSPSRKLSRAHLEAQDASNRVTAVGGERSETGKIRLEKLSRQMGHHEQPSKSRKHEGSGDTNNGRRPLGYEDKSRKGKNIPPEVALADKYKVSDAGPTVPSTGIAANAIDDDVDTVETEERSRLVRDVEASTGTEAGISKVPHLQFLPPPPPPPLIPQNAHQQLKGKDDNVDVGRGDEETVEVDII